MTTEILEYEYCLPTTSSTPLSDYHEEILHNRIAQKKSEMQKATERAVTYKLWTEIETLQWVLGQSLNVRRRMEPNDGRYYC